MNVVELVSNQWIAFKLINFGCVPIGCSSNLGRACRWLNLKGEMQGTLFIHQNLLIVYKLMSSSTFYTIDRYNCSCFAESQISVFKLVYDNLTQKGTVSSHLLQTVWHRSIHTEEKEWNKRLILSSFNQFISFFQMQGRSLKRRFQIQSSWVCQTRKTKADEHKKYKIMFFFSSS